MLIAKELQERNGYVSFEGDVVKAREFIEPSGVTAFGLEDEYPNTTNLTEGTAFRINPSGRAIADEFVDTAIGVGDTVIVDGIEALIVYEADEEEEWGKYLAVDKNHDLCYYLEGSDFVDDNSYYNSEMYKWAFCWGKYDDNEGKTGVNKTAIGTGLINTNTLLSLNLQQYYSDRPTVWDKLQKFRSSHSDRWFIPSLRELEQVFIQQERLQNISKINYNYYWTSSEDGNRSSYARIIYVYKNTVPDGNFIRKQNIARTRACIYLSDSDFEKGKVSVKRKYESFNVGDTVIVDGIESCVVYKAETEQSWGRYIVIDKNHGLSFYVNGSDWVDSPNYEFFPGTYGYEWGGYGVNTHVLNDDEIGMGLSNTDRIIALNLKPETEGWYVLWDKVKEFRNKYGQKWFVPSEKEIINIDDDLVETGILNNIGDKHNILWTSSSGAVQARVVYPQGGINSDPKNRHSNKCRLCRYITDSDILNGEVTIKPSYEVGKVYSIDFIDAMCVYDAGSEQSWGRYMFAEVEDSITSVINDNSYSGSLVYATSIGNGYSNWLFLRYYDWKSQLYTAVRGVTEHRRTQWFVPCLNELKNGLQTMGQFNSTFYLSSSKGALNLWGTFVGGDDSDTLNRECHIKLFTTDKLINAEYKVGDYREINGIDTVCFLDRLTVDEGRYLFADRHGLAYYLKGVEDDWDISIDDMKSSYAWGTDNSLTNLDRQIGYGYPNTESALATDLVNQDTIWKALRDVQVQRNDDRWFLPSLFELMPLYEQKKNIGNLPYGGQNAWLWSSSCANASTAYSLSFYDGAQGQNAKINPYHARAVYADKTIPEYFVGDKVKIGRISNCVIIYKADTLQPWGRYIAIDPHSLEYYSYGNDPGMDSNGSSTELNPDWYGLEWGAYNTHGWSFEDFWGDTEEEIYGIGTGLRVTDRILSTGGEDILTPSNTYGRQDNKTVWQALNEIRGTRGKEWFIPSLKEMEIIYANASIVGGLYTGTTATADNVFGHWVYSSSVPLSGGGNQTTAYATFMGDNTTQGVWRSSVRSCRLCHYL